MKAKGRYFRVAWTTLVCALFVLCTFTNAFAQAENAFCSDAVALNIGDTVSGDTTSGGQELVGQFCGTSITTNGVWYTVVGDGNTLTASTCNQASYDTKISVFCDDCEEPFCVGGVDDSSGCSGFTTSFSWCTTPGVVYNVLLHGFGAATGSFDLTVSSDEIACEGAVECPLNAIELEKTVVEGSFSDPGDCSTDDEITVNSGTEVTYCYTVTNTGNTVLTEHQLFDDQLGDLELPSGGPLASNCCEANGGLGCDEQTCEDLICGSDPFCCDTSWDGICASAAISQCEVCQGIVLEPGDMYTHLETAVITEDTTNVATWTAPCGPFNPPMQDDDDDDSEALADDDDDDGDDDDDDDSDCVVTAEDSATVLIDDCPEDPAKTEPGVCGCGTPDIDSDGDEVLDCNDDCPEDALIIEGSCDAQCDQKVITNELFEMDGSGLALRQFATKVQRRIAKLTGKKGNGKALVNTNKAEYAKVWTLTWSIDEVVESNCTNSHLCVAISNAGTVSAYNSGIEAMFVNNKKLLGKLRRALGGKTRKWKKLNKQNKNLREQALSAASVVPTADSQCS